MIESSIHLQSRQAQQGNAIREQMTIMTIEQVLAHLPHRPPFLLLDSVDEVVPDEYIVGRKSVSSNEPYFLGHYPGNPIMPGMLIVEALAQLCCVLTCKSTGKRLGDGFLHYLAGLDNAHFERRVRPGDVLELRGELTSRRLRFMKFDCEARVDGKRACSVKLICAERKIEP